MHAKSGDANYNCTSFFRFGRLRYCSVGGGISYCCNPSVPAHKDDNIRQQGSPKAMASEDSLDKRYLSGEYDIRHSAIAGDIIGHCSMLAWPTISGGLMLHCISYGVHGQHLLFGTHVACFVLNNESVSVSTIHIFCN